MADKYRQQGRQEMIDMVPDNWLHPIFNDFLGRDKFTAKDIEKVFLELRKRMLEVQNR